MAIRDTEASFGAVTKLLHWVTFLAVAGTVVVAWTMQAMPLGVAKLQAYGLHKSIGVTLLAVTLARVGWRWANPRPMPLGGPPWQNRLARVVHAGLYLCLLALPVLGLLHSAAANTPVQVFGLFVLPAPIAPERGLVEPLRQAHQAVAWLLLALVGLHVLGALKRQLLDRDGTLLRMLPLSGGRPRRRSGDRVLR